MNEIIAFEQQWQVKRLGQGVGETIAHVQSGPMASATAKSAARIYCNRKMCGIKRDGLNKRIGQKVIQKLQAMDWLQGQQHTRAFKSRRSADQFAWC